jgi:hypothetical protein
MQHVTLRVTLSLIALTAFDGAVGQELSGRYVGADDASITLTLSESASGAITGSGKSLTFGWTSQLRSRPSSCIPTL